MKQITEAPHDIENQKDPFLEELYNLSDLSPERCIYRVPERLRQVNEKAYTPQVVSIGPLHHGNGHLKAMEEHKKRYLRDFLSRPGVRFCDCIQMIKNQEKELRGFYAESIEFFSDEFVRIVLVDAAFVIELLLRYYHKYGPDEDYSQGEDYIFNNPWLLWDVQDEDYIFNNPWMLWDVLPDLRLLENQLPFFILQDLFNKLSFSSQLPSLLKISSLFFERGFIGWEKEENFVTRLENFVARLSSGKVQHFVDLIRILYRPLDQEKKPKTTSTSKTTATPKPNYTPTPNLTATPKPNYTATPIPSKATAAPIPLKATPKPRKATPKPTATPKPRKATPNYTATPNVTELHQAGVKFKPGEGSSLFDIKFSRGILEIPKLTMEDSTDLTLRNLLAFEQCDPREEYCLANYVFLMMHLARTQEDVQLLVDKGIIENWLGDTQKISTLLHDLGTGMMVDHRYYETLCKDLIEFRRKRWRGWMVILKQKYFNTPWSTISVAAAVILLLLTLIQTACSYKSVPLL
ncbi:UPF0481 protein At3g47200-like isoform X2 [Malus domestica]|uniref:UPF0481 protein At3g47200-like isoform X2 n=1 Tax=Malus domestica TaxID=3750 RepID=UPI0039769C48